MDVSNKKQVGRKEGRKEDRKEGRKKKRERTTDRKNVGLKKYSKEIRYKVDLMTRKYL